MSELFFSKRLTDKMEHMRKAGFTIVEAPAGYGKTTLVNEALKELSEVYWYIAIKNVRKGSWQWFLDRLMLMDAECAAQLKALGTITKKNVDVAAECLMQAEVSQSVYIILDNFQYVIQEWQPQLLAALARRKNDGLHVICISQYMGELHRTPQRQNQTLCVVLEEELLLNREEIQSLARMKGIEMTPAAVERIFVKTNGWVVAVGIYLRKRKKKGEHLSTLNETNELLYNLFWKQLTQKEQQVLLRLSPFDWAGIRYMDQIFPDKPLKQKELHELFARVPLLEFIESKQTYVAHELLLHFLRFQLVITDEKFCRNVYCHAGEIYYKYGWMQKAVECFYKAKDYDKLLACDLSGMLMEQFDGITYQELAGVLLKQCPVSIQKKHLISVLKLCYALFAATAFDSFEKYMEQTRSIIEQEGNDQMMGEWLMVYALSEFPDVDRMREIYEKAEKLMLESSKVFNREEPFLFGCTSMLYLFWHRRGGMMQTASQLERMMEIYNRLTDGHGAGAVELYRAETLVARGCFKESECLVYQAQQMAEKTDNISIIFGVAQLRGITAVYQSDVYGIRRAAGYLNEQVQRFEKPWESRMRKCMEESVRSYVFAIMMETEHSAEWTRGEADGLTDLTFTNFIVKVSRATDLIKKREYNRAIAGIEASMHLDRRILSMPARSMMYVGLILCHMAVGRMTEALEYLFRELELIKEDKNYLYIACYRKYLTVFMQVPSLVERYRKEMQEIEKVEIKYIGTEKISMVEMLESPDERKEILTKREWEIARLAAKGYRNTEIAQTLHISENTVKSHLKIIFRKLEIDRRSYLKEALRRYTI